MTSIESNRRGWPRFEILACVATVALVFQLFPSLASKLLWAADIRNWTASVRIAAAGIFASILLLMRYGPEMVESQRAKSTLRAREQAQMEKQRQAIEARQRRQAIEKGRKRLIY